MNAKEILIKCAGFDDVDEIIADRGDMPDFKPDEEFMKKRDIAEKQFEASHVLFSDAKRSLHEDIIDGISKYRKMLFDCKRDNELYAPYIDAIEAWNPPTRKHEWIKSNALKYMRGNMFSDGFIQSLEDHLRFLICNEETREDVYKDAGLKIDYAYTRLRDCNRACDADVARKKEEWEFRNKFFASIKDM